MINNISISLTSIESRVKDGILEATLDNLQKQTFNIDKIYVVIPSVNLKGEKLSDTLPEYIYKYDNVVVVRPNKDHGPIMKYIGAVDQIESEWVWVCDDDTLYRYDKIEDDINEFNNNNYSDRDVYCQLTQNIFIRRYVMGVSGVLINKNALKQAKYEIENNRIDKCCRKVDDQWISMILQDLGYTLRGSSSNKKLHHSIHPMLKGIKESSLSSNTPRTKLVLKCIFSQPDILIYTIILLFVLSILLIKKIKLFILMLIVIISIFTFLFTTQNLRMNNVTK